MGEKGGRKKSPEAEQHSEKSIRLCCFQVRSFILDLSSVGGLVHFSQLEAPVEPDDGAEGERWQHAPSSAGGLLAGCCWSSRENEIFQSKGLQLRLVLFGGLRLLPSLD